MTAGSVVAIFSAVNSPPLVASAGVVAAACLPVLEQATVSSLTLPTVKILNVLLYFINFIAAQQPGRLDGIESEDYFEKIDKTKGDDDDKNETKLIKELANNRRRSLFNPSGWAFTIWAPIFLGELIFSTSSSFLVNAETSPVVNLFRKASAGFMIAQVFQTLWAASFRPKYFVGPRKSSKIWVSAGMLTGISASLSRAHQAFTSDEYVALYTLKEYGLYFLPMSLHFGWTAAAALVNLNGNIAALAPNNKKLLAASAYGSVIVATSLGVAVTVIRQAPVFGGVIAWALTACSTGVQDRINAVKKDDKLANQPGYYGTKTQKWLCRIGAVISAAASIATAINMKKQ